MNKRKIIAMLTTLLFMLNIFGFTFAGFAATNQAFRPSEKFKANSLKGKELNGQKWEKRTPVVSAEKESVKLQKVDPKDFAVNQERIKQYLDKKPSADKKGTVLESEKVKPEKSERYQKQEQKKAQIMQMLKQQGQQSQSEKESSLAKKLAELGRTLPNPKDTVSNDIYGTTTNPVEPNSGPYEPNDETPYPISVPGVYNAAIESTSDIDLYSFEVTAQSNYQITMSGLSSDMDISLFDVNYNYIGGSYNGGSTTDSFNVTLSSGTYIISVYSYSGTSNYTLSVENGSNLNDPNEPNNTLDTATPLAIGQELQGSLPDYNDYDYFSFTISNPGFYNLNLNANGYLWYDLFNENNYIYGDYVQGCSVPLKFYESGTYYIALSEGSSVQYGISLSTSVPANDSYEPNDLLEQAAAIQVPAAINGIFGYVNDTDFYTFNLSEAGGWSVNINPDYYGDSWVGVLDSNYNFIGEAYCYKDASGYIDFYPFSSQLVPGTYYLITQGYPYSWDQASPNSYTLSVAPTTIGSDPYEPNDWFTEAYPIGNGNYQGVIPNEYDWDIFKYSTSGTGTLNASLTLPNGVDYDLLLCRYDPNIDYFSVIGGSWQEGYYNEAFSYALNSPGDYYIVVVPWSGFSNEPYSLGVNFDPADFSNLGPYEPNNEIPYPISIPGTYNAAIESSSDVDLYSFVVTSQNNCQIDLSGLSDNVDIELYDMNWSYIGGSYGTGTTEAINATLNTGIYYIYLYTCGGPSNYTLSVNYGSGNDPDIYEPNNWFDQATPITPGSYQAYIPTPDDYDFYSFNLTTQSVVDVQLTNLPFDIDMDLVGVNPNGDYYLINMDWVGGMDNEHIIQTLPSGTYYLVVYPYEYMGSQSPYTLSLGVTSGVIDSYEPNDMPWNPAPLENQVNSYISNERDLDAYYIYKEQPGSIQLSLTNLPANYDLDLYDEYFNLVGSSWNDGTNNENINYDAVNSGTYLAVVYSPYAEYSSAPYTLSVNGNSQSVEVSAVPQGNQPFGVGSQFTVPVVVNNVNNLYGAEIHMNFDSNRLEVVDVNTSKAGVNIAPGNVFDPDNSFVALNNADNSQGAINFAATMMAPAEPFSGTGTIAEVTFRTKAEGTAYISFNQVLLSDPSSQPIQNIVSDSYVELVNGGTVTGSVNVDGRTNKSGVILWLDGNQLTNITTAADGTFTLPMVSSGSHIVKATLPCYIWDEQTIDVIANQTTNVNLHLIAGDVNGDGTINIFDLVAVGVAFGGNDMTVDINADSAINIFDLVLVGTNFGLSHN